MPKDPDIKSSTKTKATAAQKTNAKKPTPVKKTSAKSKLSLKSVSFKEKLNKLGAKPASPLVPIIVCPEPTFEGLCKLMIVSRPSLGIFSSEGGQFVGGYGMSAIIKFVLPLHCQRCGMVKK